jgi:hypothetical protein
MTEDAMNHIVIQTEQSHGEMLLGNGLGVSELVYKRLCTNSRYSGLLGPLWKYL